MLTESSVAVHAGVLLHRNAAEYQHFVATCGASQGNWWLFGSGVQHGGTVHWRMCWQGVVVVGGLQGKGKS